MRFTFEDTRGREDIFKATSLDVALQYAARHGLFIVCPELLPFLKPHTQPIAPMPIIIVGAVSSG